MREHDARPRVGINRRKKVVVHISVRPVQQSSVYIDCCANHEASIQGLPCWQVESPVTLSLLHRSDLLKEFITQRRSRHTGFFSNNNNNEEEDVSLNHRFDEPAHDSWITVSLLQLVTTNLHFQPALINERNVF